MAKVPTVAGVPSSPGAEHPLEPSESLLLTVRCLIACVLRRSPLDPAVQDCAQETMRRVLEGRDRLAPGRPERPWVLGIARHVALDWRRAQQRAARRAGPEGAAPDSSPDSSPLHRVPSPEPALDEHVAAAEQHQRVLTALERLPAPQRQALWLFHAEGRSYREIALQLSVPVGTVGTWILRARAQLAAALPTEEDP